MPQKAGTSAFVEESTACAKDQWRERASMSEDSVLHDEAELQEIHMEKVVGDSSIQKI